MAAQDTRHGDLPTSVHIGKLSDSADDDDDDFGEADDFQVEDERATMNGGAYSSMNQ